MRFNVKVLSLTCGIIWGATLFLITWWLIYFEGSTGNPTIIGAVYRGYRISAMGSLYGLGWGVVDGLIFGAIFGWLYNFLAARFEKKA